MATRAAMTSLARLVQAEAHLAARIVPRRGMASGGEHHGPPKVNIWQDPLSPSKWKEEQFVLLSIAGWGLVIYGGSKAFSGKKPEATQEATAK